MASPQQSAQAVATFLGRAGRLAVFAGLGGAALQAALYTGVALCLQFLRIHYLLAEQWVVLLLGMATATHQCNKDPLEPCLWDPHTNATNEHVLRTCVLSVSSKESMDAPLRAMQPCSLEYRTGRSMSA